MRKSNTFFLIAFTCSIILFLTFAFIPVILGLTPVAEKTEAMNGTISKYSLAYVNRNKEEKSGSVVAVNTGAEKYIARIIEISDTEVKVLGDNEEAENVNTIQPDYIVGVVSYVVPYAGILGSWEPGILSAMLLPIMFAVGTYRGVFAKWEDE